MTGDVEKQVLDHLQAVQSDLDAMGEMLKEHGIRLTEIATSLAAMRRTPPLDTEA